MISIIAAISKNNVLGNKGIIPWQVKGEQKRFKELTTGKTIIMGRKSFEEIRKPLSILIFYPAKWRTKCQFTDISRQSGLRSNNFLFARCASIAERFFM